MRVLNQVFISVRISVCVYHVLTGYDICSPALLISLIL